MNGKLQARLLCGAAVMGLMSAAGAASAAEANFAIPPQSLASALSSFSEQSGRPVLYRPEIATAKVSPGATGEVDAEIALNQLLAGTGLSWKPDGDTFLIVKADQDPQSGSAAGDGAEGTVEALIVTAQKREEDIQDVPIAISAFTQETLENSQIAGGPDLMTQVPNMTFTKTNFSSYSIQIRGIGTQAISATTDPAVAVAFNNTPFIENRFFEQEFYDLQRVEVLRGPQGTLYGRNATAGVVNLISAKPKFNFEAKLGGDIANYNTTRIEGMVNIPVVEDVVALRLAGAWTKREGYATNEITGNPIDGRDLWSTRVSLRFSPNDRLDANLIWEHFEEDDDRIRSGKQLCMTDEVTSIAGFPTSHFDVPPGLNQGLIFQGSQGTTSQGCAPNSLYDAASFQTPNGLSLPYYVVLGAIGFPSALDDPYVNRTQSRDLRVIESTVDPHYLADADIVEFQLSFDITDDLTLSSETGWGFNSVFSTQDYNRFNTQRGAFTGPSSSDDLFGRDNLVRLNDDGFWEFYDPQIGWADRLVAVDLSTGESRQFSQEFRLASDYDGPFNFSLGANFLRFDFEAKYYVFINSLSLLSALYSVDEGPYVPGVSDGTGCLSKGPRLPDPFNIETVAGCTYMDPNPIGALNDLGHNHFLSKNPYKLISYAMFGEAYYNITENLKVTAGLRWTVDKKEAPRIPSWLLAQDTLGYPVADVVRQEWREPTGRLAIDWKPELSFTDETLLYASYAHGYKAGGANPPAAGLTVYGASSEQRDLLRRDSVTKPRTFDPEFVDAFELGAKNTLFDGQVTLNLAAFYYDYKDYQISYITDRSAVNLNFDAEVWGAEIEADWRPLENLKLGFKGGYEKTRVADGEKAIDVMNRTAGDPRYHLARPFPTYSNNCVIPTWLFVGGRTFGGFGTNPQLVIPSYVGGGGNGPCENAYLLGVDPVTMEEYVPFPATLPIYQNVNYTQWSTDPNDYPGAVWPGGVVVDGDYPGFNPALVPELNGGEGLFTDLSGNELPNAPHFTATITADYTLPLPSDWLMTLHTDLYYQSEAWTRIWNLEGYDKLKAYTNVNLAAIFTNEDAGWKVMAYVKNVMDRDSITGSFLNSDDSGLTTNVFLTEPRLYGLRVTKSWTGGPLLGAFGARHEGPYPFTVELGGMVQRQDAPNETFLPSFADAFEDEIEPFSDQENDLDWGDERSLKLTYAMPSGWKASLAGRWGKTNGGGRNIRQSEDTVSGCSFIACVPPYDSPDFFTYFHDNSSGETLESEEHTVVDFMVGREFGLGGLDASTVSAGIQYAQFKSSTSVDMYGIPDWAVTQNYYGKYYSYNHRYEATFQADREFKGVGPVLSWDASKSLIGNSDIGHLDLDASLSAGVLFGKQKTTASGFEQSAYYYEGLYGTPTPTPVCPITHTNNCPPTPVSLDIAPRSKSVTVPTFGASLGLSYKVDRFSIGAGYKWERYYDVIDGGVSEAKQYDRTLDGPYLKVSVGFGG